MYGKRLVTIIALALAGVAFLAVGAGATAYTWTGTTSSAWNVATNWGGSGPPGSSYTDTATIGASASNPVTLSTTALLGATSGNALTIGNYTPSGAVALDIASGGLLGVQGNITLGSSSSNQKVVRIEGTLRNDGSSGTTYNLGATSSAGGSIALNGGTISSLNGGIWNITRPISGFGTISSPFTGSATITANNTTNNLLITGNGGTTTTPFTGTLTSASGATLTIGNGTGNTITGGTVGSGAIGEIDLNNATLKNVTYSASSGTFKLTGDSTITGTFARNNVATINLNTHTLNLSGATISGVTGGNIFTVGTGKLNNSGDGSIANDGTISLGGGQFNNNSGVFSLGTAMSGFGTIYGGSTFGSAGPPVVPGNYLKLSGSGVITASGGTLAVTGFVDSTGLTMNTTAAATDILDLKGTIKGGNLYPSFSTGSLGKVYLDGATIVGSTLGSSAFPGGTVNVVSNSTLQGAVNNYANLTINSGAKLTNAGTFTNSGLLDFQITGSGPTQVGVFDNQGGSSTSLIGGNAKFDLTSFTAAAGENWEFYLGNSSLWNIPNSNVTVTGLPAGLTWEIDSVGGTTPGEVFKIDAAVPLPPSLLLLGSGLLGMGLLGWRRRNSLQA